MPRSLYYRSFREIGVAEKRQERAARKRQKELERLLKEEAKLDALTQAKLEVEAFENSLEVLLSVHKEVSPDTNWADLLSELSPHMPVDGDPVTFEEQRDHCKKIRRLAKHVLAGDTQAYEEALSEFSPFDELSAFGSSVTFRAHTARIAECQLRVNNRSAVPAEVKALTSTGKLSVRAMPKTRLHELYQDYVCGCALRAAREVFALLPVDLVIVTATVTELQSSTGTENDQPVLSVAMPRAVLDSLDFLRLDPSDAMANFKHRGDVMASRKSGEFTAIVPLTTEDVFESSAANLRTSDLLKRVRDVRAEIATTFDRSGDVARDTAAEAVPS